MKTLINFLKEEDGASAVEYGLLITFIAVAVIAGITTLGKNLATQFTTVAGQV